MTGFEIPDLADATESIDAQPDTVDFQILRDALAGTGPISGLGVTLGNGNMNAVVAAGSILVSGVPYAVTGNTLTHGAADATLTRYDLIVATSAGSVAIRAGTALSRPRFPIPSAGDVVLYAVRIDPGVTALLQTAALDKRAFVDSLIGQPVITPTALSADTDNWNPTGLATARVIRAATNDGTRRDLSGLQGGAAGRIILLVNLGTGRIGLVHDQTSTAANRFYIGEANAGDILYLGVGQSVFLVYDGVYSRWRVVQTAQKGHATPLVAGTATAGNLEWLSSEDHVHPSEIPASTGYTPTLTQSGAVTKTVTYAQYIQFGKLVFVSVFLTLTGAGTTNNPIIVGLPVASVTYPNEHVLGVGKYEDIGTALYMLHARWASSTTIKFWRTDTTPTNDFGADPNFAAASTDTLSFTLVYEAA